MSLRTLFTAGALVTVGLLAGRILGLVREMLLATYFGTTGQADMAISLLVIPDFITGALVGSSIGVALLPRYAAEPEKASQLCWQALTLSVGFFAVLALAVGLGITGVSNLGNEGAMAITYSPFAFLIAVCAIPLTAATAILTSYLQHRGRFAVPAFANVIFNTGIISALVFLPQGLLMLAVGIMLAAGLRLAFHAVAYWRAGGQGPRGAFAQRRIDQPMLRTYMTTVTTDVCTLFPQFAPYIVIAAANGSLAAYNYAFKLAFVPVTLGTTLAQMVLLPWFIRVLHADEGKDKVSHYLVTLQVAWCFSLAACLSLSLASYDIAQLCFGYGKMTEDDIKVVSRLFDIGIWALPGMFVSSIWQQVMYAKGKAKLPLLAAGTLALAIAPSCWLGYRVMGLEGVALAYVVLQWIPAVWLSYAGYRQGVIRSLAPSPLYLRMTLVTLAVWLPLGWLFNSASLPAVVGLVIAAFIGAFILAAGLAMSPPVRQWGLQKLSTKK